MARKPTRYVVRVVETRLVECLYVVEASSEGQASRKAVIGDTIENGERLAGNDDDYEIGDRAVVTGRPVRVTRSPVLPGHTLYACSFCGWRGGADHTDRALDGAGDPYPVCPICGDDAEPERVGKGKS